MNDLDLPWVIFGLMKYAAFVISFTFHEAAHAWTAWKLGDKTAYEAGSVSLNPWVHMQRSPIGTMLMPLLSWIFLREIIGWASAPIGTAWAERWPKRYFLVSMAGPLMNLLLMLAALLGMRAILQYSGTHFADLLHRTTFDQLMVQPSTPAIRFFGLLRMMMELNLLLLVFNLLPFPPLDGSSIWRLVLPPRAFRRYQDFANDPNFIMLGLMVGSAVATQILIKVYPPLWMLLAWGLN